MKTHLPVPTIIKTKKQMAMEYGMSERTFRRRLVKYGIAPPKGLILPVDQLRIYEALGPPLCVWIDDHTLKPFDHTY